MNADDIFPVLFIGLGTWLFYLSRKRVFDRRNPYGNEVFPSYGGKLIARIIDWCLVAGAFVLAGTGILTLASAHVDSWGLIVLLPVVGFFVIGYFPPGRRP